MAERPLHVLLVEDNPADARLVQLALGPFTGASGVTLEHVTRLSAALEPLHRGDLDVVLLDLSLPDAHGATAVRGAHAASPHTPILVLTGTSDPSTLRQALEAGARGTIQKHVFAKGELGEAIRQVALDVSTSDAASDRRPLPRAPASPGTNEAGTSRPIDPQALRELRALAPAGEEDVLVSNVVNAFLEQGRRLGEILGEAVARQDAECVRMTAHSFRSTSVHVGAWELTELADKVERLAAIPDFGGVRELLGQLQGAFADAQRALGPFSAPSRDPREGTPGPS